VADNLRALYDWCYRRLVAQVYAVTADISDAQDAVRKAFVRALTAPRDAQRMLSGTPPPTAEPADLATLPVRAPAGVQGWLPAGRATWEVGFRRRAGAGPRRPDRGDLVGVLQVAANRQAAGQPGHP